MSVTYLHVFYDIDGTARRVSDMTYAAFTSVGDGNVWLVAPDCIESLFHQWLSELKERLQAAFNRARIAYALEGSTDKVGFALKSITVTRDDIKNGYMPDADDFLVGYVND